MRDFFISYNKNDRSWAEWIAWQLEKAEYTTIVQQWDFRPGSNFVQEMQRAAIETKRTIAVLSPDYIKALYTHAEWSAAFAQDPTGEASVLVPVRVRECEIRGILAQIVYIDLVGLDAPEAERVLLNGVLPGRAKPGTAPSFPGITTHWVGKPPIFPGTSSVVLNEQTTRDNNVPKAVAFAVSLSITTPNQLRMVKLNLSKSTQDTNLFGWQLEFVLNERRKTSDAFKPRASLLVKIGMEQNDKAEATARNGLDKAQEAAALAAADSARMASDGKLPIKTAENDVRRIISVRGQSE